MPTAEDLVKEAVNRLKRSTAFEHPAGKDRSDATDMLTFAIGREADPDEEVPASAALRFRRLVERRMSGEPVAYMTGQTTFHGLTLDVGPGAFIPRQSTEFMAEQAIRRLRSRRHPVHVDLGTGVGPVALAVAAAVPRARIFGVDLGARPVRLARRNAARLGLRNATFLQGDLLRPLPDSIRASVDAITIHPPYVGRRELRDLPVEIKAYEPKESLTDFSPKGMGLLGRVAAEGPAWLRPGGWLLVEVSPDRSRDVAATLRRAGFRDVRSTVGEIRVSRVVVGRA